MTPTKTDAPRPAKADRARITKVRRRRRRARRTKRLAVSHAFHSPHMDSMLAEFEQVARRCRFQPPRMLFPRKLLSATHPREEEE